MDRDRLRALWSSPAGRFGALAGRPGYSMPDLEGLSIIELAPGIAIPKVVVAGGGPGCGNFLIVPQGWSPTHTLSITLSAQAVDNLLIIGRDANLVGRIDFHGARGGVIVGGQMRRICNVQVLMLSDDASLFLGRFATANSAKIIVEGVATRVTIGDDCMFSGDVTVRSTDQHAIVSLDDEQPINRPADVLIEPHVWLGEGVMVLKGTRIGFGSVVGSRSVVTRDVGRFSVAAGHPARVLRTGTCWTRRWSPPPGQVQRLRDQERLLESWPIVEGG